ncbi:MAG: hypothetical protein PHO89_11495, partial [Methylacidiphilaceae bacterium]|nr:hypothetical protein [Candidatus Methylacidiphilaceae bacterium]
GISHERYLYSIHERLSSAVPSPYGSRKRGKMEIAIVANGSFAYDVATRRQRSQGSKGVGNVARSYRPQ